MNNKEISPSKGQNEWSELSDTKFKEISKIIQGLTIYQAKSILTKVINELTTIAERTIVNSQR